MRLMYAFTYCAGIRAKISSAAAAQKVYILHKKPSLSGTLCAKPCAPERRASLASGPDTPHCGHASADPSAGRGGTKHKTRGNDHACKGPTATAPRQGPRPDQQAPRGSISIRSRQLVQGPRPPEAAPAHHPSGCWISAGRAPRSRSDNLIISTTERHAALPYQGSARRRPASRLCRKWLLHSRRIARE